MKFFTVAGVITLFCYCCCCFGECFSCCFQPVQQPFLAFSVKVSFDFHTATPPFTVFPNSPLPPHPEAYLLITWKSQHSQCVLMSSLSCPMAFLSYLICVCARVKQTLSFFPLSFCMFLWLLDVGLFAVGPVMPLSLKGYPYVTKMLIIYRVTHRCFLGICYVMLNLRKVACLLLKCSGVCGRYLKRKKSCSSLT